MTPKLNLILTFLLVFVMSSCSASPVQNVLPAPPFTHLRDIDEDVIYVDVYVHKQVVELGHDIPQR